MSPARVRDAPAGIPGGAALGCLAALACAVALLLAPPAAAQTPDSTAAFPVAVDSTAAAPSDTTTAAGRAVALAAPQAPPWGRAATPVYALTGAISPEALLADRPEAFGYALGTPGRWGGVSLFGLEPAAPSLELDGRAFDDLYTGAPRLDLLPAEALGPLRLGGPGGAPLALAAETRPFRLGRPITELRYQGGQESVQHASATHAQTRRAPGLGRRLAGEGARTTLTAHAATRGATGPSAGGQTRHSHALGRLVVAGPRRAVELGALYADRLDGARRGLTGASRFDPAAATVLDGSATRRTLRTELWATLRAPVFGAEPLGVTLGTAGQRLRYSPDAIDTLQASVNRVALDLAQTVRLGAHRVGLRATLASEGDPSGGTDVFGDGGARRRASLSALDSLAVGGWTLATQPGLHLVDARLWPSARLALSRGGLRLGARAGARAPARLAERGLAGRVAPDPSDALERTARGDASLTVGRGAVELRLAAWGAHVVSPQRLLAGADTFAVVRGDALTSLGGALGLAWREAARRGLYARLTAAAARTLGDGELARREDDALPALRADGRLGWRAAGVRGVLDLDLGVRAAGWSAFRSRVLEPTTGALALPDPSTPLGQTLPARGTVGLDLAATLAERATVFLQYGNALGGRLYDGAIVTQGEPLTATPFRFGVFWALLD